MNVFSGVPLAVKLVPYLVSHYPYSANNTSAFVPRSVVDPCQIDPFNTCDDLTQSKLTHQLILLNLDARLK